MTVYTVNTKTSSVAQQIPAPTGYIALAQQAGFHACRLIPVIPPHASGVTEKLLGKTPGYVCDGGILWQPLRAWQHGTTALTREACDAAGCNVGLLTGVPFADYQYLALDGDFEGADKEFVLKARAVFIDTLAKELRSPPWIRDTREGRCAALVRISSHQIAGRRTTVTLAHPEHGSMGAIEILATKNQIVIAGNHKAARRPITWWRTDKPDDKYPTPTVGAGIPIFANRAAVDGLLDKLLLALGEIGITYTLKKEHDPAANSNQINHADQAPPSADLLIEVLKVMPNPVSASYGDYSDVMLAVEGCIRALRGLNKITPEVENDVIREAAAWASRWQSPNALTGPAEEAAYRWKFKKTETVQSGWTKLQKKARELGSNDAEYLSNLAYMTGAEDFEALEPLPTPDLDSEVNRDAQPEPAGTVEESAYPRGRKPSVKFLTLQDIEDLPPQEWLIDGLIPKGGFFLLSGRWKSTKTFIMLSKLLHIAAGLDWMGKKTQQGAVVYIVGEGVTGIQKRIEAMKKHYGISNDVPFYVIGRAVNFMDGTAVQHLGEDIEDLMQEKGQTLAIFVVDTVARAMPGADENSVKDMGVLITACDQLREQLKCAAAGVHHLGKDANRGPRGSTALPGAIDAGCLAEHDKDTCVTTMTTTDMRDGESGEVMTFDMLKTLTSDGKSTLVPVLRKAAEVSQGVAPMKVKEPTGDLGVAWIALKEALRLNGVDQSGIRVCTADAWREIYYSKKIDLTPSGKQKGFTRAGDKLIGRGMIDVKGDNVWLKTVGCEDFTPMRSGEMDTLMNARPVSGAIN